MDDDESIRGSLEDLLLSVGVAARSFASAEEFRQSGYQQCTACLISDIRMPGMNGLELQTRLASGNDRIPIIFITAVGDSRLRAQAMRAGAVEFLSKPINEEVLLENIWAVLKGSD